MILEHCRQNGLHKKKKKSQQFIFPQHSDRINNNFIKLIMAQNPATQWEILVNQLTELNMDTTTYQNYRLKNK